MRTAIKHLKKDPVMARIIAEAGPFRMEYGVPRFENLVRSIVSQQLNGKVARVIFGRLQEAVCGVSGVPEVTPAGILRLRTERMRRLGLSAAKTLYIRELAKHTKRGKVVFESLPELEDVAVIEHLTQVKGIGIWTAQMFLMFALRRNDVLPVGDLGIRMAMKGAYGLEDLPRPAEMERIAAAWKPYTSIACWYLWRSLDAPKQKKEAGID
jgi:DNA-3-methyladenine glycosylase II